MKILILAATHGEIAPTLKLLHGVKRKNELSMGTYHGHTIHALVTGVGMMAMAYYAGRQLNRKYDIAINAGIAGSFKKRFPIGTVVQVINDQLPELGKESEHRFLTFNNTGMPVENIFSNISALKIKALRDLIKVRGITVNTVHGKYETIEKVIRKFNPDVETMEGASFIFACNKNNIPCVQLRAISNFVEPRNRKRWDIALAVKNLNDALLKILNQL